MTTLPPQRRQPLETLHQAAAALASLWSGTAVPAPGDLRITDAQEREIERRLFAGNQNSH